MEREKKKWIGSYSSKFSVPVTSILFSVITMFLITHANFRNITIFLNPK